MMNTDRQLIQRAQEGDMSAFQELVRKHDRAVFSVAARFVRSSDDAKDIYQEVFIKVYRGLKGFRGQSEFSTWVYRIAMNTCLSHARRSTLTKSISWESRDADEAEPHSTLERADIDENSPEREAIGSDHAHHIRRALDALSSQQRLVFTLRHYEGHTLKEIAGMMECSEGTVKRYLFLATRRMRGQLQHLLNE